MRDVLKIISKSQAEASRLTRKMEKAKKAEAAWLRERQKPCGDTEKQLSELHKYRTCGLREYSRSVHLYRAFLKGTPYGCVEDPKTRKKDIKAFTIFLDISALTEFDKILNQQSDLLQCLSDWLTSHERV